ncbi:tellurite resistance/C4-dicarboxylate transporter family protein [Mycobacterium montefiorense]|uniref:C4-dicarboxylate ABC transporter n=1 Tax=Mycobacterium montefiorense TaxID=154654 RepID=A0AA37PQ50_9MYCO|nr:tellurite resistance/C4-dicarboxylate transporter family protein [Mycobacterium montefiorense]GBG36264.1 C4-dicarboxylate ABC transporter [Mycobacterium montefiorense]GKU32967.1 C4-dicarboxylate ABC transporter [Mycobacterium montefiorense]GKU38563.1 C4-dicarboxylate ABC transporter [Mycobacterium montefiorense]GKU46670.1 C4-dicarboxylate ABC transporter [Mycobacterium montefiorense]GKU51557.1 C4-dicarboxylate ABC transporter [Mycobacterium montefiorense]
MRFRLADFEPSPDVFAAVMATGILSIAAGNHHYGVISQALGVLASLGFLVLVALVIVTRRLARWDFTDPDVTLRLFTFVAACAVLDSRLASQPALLWVLGLAALASWLVLVALSARNMSTRGWSALRRQAHGAWELASVGTSGLAIVASKVARYPPQHWWLSAAVFVWVAALCIYALMTWLILWRTVAEWQHRAGFEPDTWILMGGLAIATLAGDNIHRLAPAWLSGPVLVVTVVTWLAATLWIPPLIYFGLHRMSHRPEMLHFAGVWWAFVFPLGMYSAASYTMAAELGHRSLITVSLVFCWDALAAWLIVAIAGLLRARRAIAGD